MNELESILNYLETTSLEPHNDYTSEFTYKDQKIDAYNQAIINIDLIVTYLISELKINFRNRED